MVFSERTDELILVWKHPVTRSRYVIGRLWKDMTGYHFRYERVARRGIEEALTSGFRLLESFAELDCQYDSVDLFATFQRRLPPKWRHEGLRDSHIDPEDAMTYFRLTGGRVATDTLEFLEPIYAVPSSQRAFVVKFPVAGWRYYDGESVISDLRVGDIVQLKVEPDNQFDRNAIRILVGPDARLVGYVPALYAWYIDESVIKNLYTATIVKIGLPDDPQDRLWLEVQGQSSFGPDGDLSNSINYQKALLW